MNYETFKGKMCSKHCCREAGLEGNMFPSGTVQGGPSALGKGYVDSKFEVAFSSKPGQASQASDGTLNLMST